LEKNLADICQGHQVDSSMSKFVDLHSHSFASPDAVGHPGDVARHFHQSGHKAFSLTDHNSILGHEEAAAAAAECGIEFIRGVEMASSPAHLPDFYGGGGQDLLCYFFEETPGVMDLLKPAQDAFKERINFALAAVSREGGKENAKERFQELLHTRYNSHASFLGIQREAFCDFLIESRILDPAQAEASGLTMSEWRRQAGRSAVNRYSKAAGYQNLKDPKQNIEHVVKVMREAGAVIVMAHPGRGGREANAAEKKRIHLFLDHFVDGVEILHHSNSAAYRKMLFEIVAERQCLWTGGGDRHNYTAIEGHPSEATEECLTLLKRCHAQK